jgi:hypothetical protein
MTIARLTGVAVFIFAVITGTLIDTPAINAAADRTVLVGDFHVHGMPGDGALPVWEIQREARRRGLDVIAITNHNSNLSWRIGNALGLIDPYPVVIPGEELTTANFHIAAIGIRTMVDPTVSARDAILAIQQQGGVAIAAHPVPRSWRVQDPDVLAALDGIEASHPLILTDGGGDTWLRKHFESIRAINPTLAPIGSTDYHIGSPLGMCRTYLLVDDVSEAAVLAAIRDGRTVASGPGDRLVGTPENVRAVRGSLRPPVDISFDDGPSKWFALIALLGLALVVLTE